MTTSIGSATSVKDKSGSDKRIKFVLFKLSIQAENRLETLQVSASHLVPSVSSLLSRV